MTRFALLHAALFTALLSCLGLAARADQAQRVLSVGGTITEIIYALGQQDRLIGRDTTSSYPQDAQSLPDVGYMRRLSPEGVLALNPDLILAEEGSGPPETIALLKEAAIPFQTIPGGFDADSISARIMAVAQALNVADRGAALADQVRTQLSAAAAQVGTGPAPKTLFILSLQGGRVLASGTGTGADAMIALAGGQNTMTAFSGYKPVTDEALIANPPDVILMMDRAGGPAEQIETLRTLPALMNSPAVQNNRIVAMDGLLMLGFGPRIGQAVTDLSEKLTSAGH